MKKCDDSIILEDVSIEMDLKRSLEDFAITRLSRAATILRLAMNEVKNAKKIANQRGVLLGDLLEYAESIEEYEKMKEDFIKIVKKDWF